MHRAFRLLENSFDETNCYNWIEDGKQQHLANQESVRLALENFVSAGRINGSQLKEHWFPTVDAEVFISHSREDQNLAFALAGWLQDTFGITSFIDSCVWGYAGDLLRQIDNDHCWQRESRTYNYRSRNGSTSHVHMMLSTALAKMMDKTECVIFVSSPASVTTEGSIATVSSPWIYFELTMTALLRVRPIEDYRVIKEAQTRDFSAKPERLPIFYEASFDSLTTVDGDSLNKWARRWRNKVWAKSYPLDILY
ncbi:MAG: hypothetical protein KDK97_24720, partial [Verrucomicrobiales bacterium]|nr:hypothetical protein [Verrucomicrobiales bacterium]